MHEVFKIWIFQIFDCFGCQKCPVLTVSDPQSMVVLQNGIPSKHSQEYERVGVKLLI